MVVEPFCRRSGYTLAMDRVFADTAALFGDSARASMVLALLDGTAQPAGQLAMIAHIAPQTASSHLAKLVSGRLLGVEQQGRHRYYRLANANVATAIEAILAITPRSNRNRGTGQISPETTRELYPAERKLSYARTCYSHLAGLLAVDIAEALQRREFIVSDGGNRYRVTKSGRAWFEHIGISISAAQLKRPRFAKCCLDWTERRHHIAGDLGSAMLARFRELKWIAPLSWHPCCPGHGRG